MNDRRPNIYFRADASPTIGYGHFVRTLALADMVGENFCRIFATRNPTPYLREQAANVCDRVIALGEGEDHFDEFLDLLQSGDIVVLDNYFYNTDYQRLIRDRGCRLVAVDDMHDKHYVADILINHVLIDVGKFSVEPYTRLCLGLDWALVRREFFVPLPVERQKGHVVVAFGGVDYHNLTARVVEVLLGRADVVRVTAIVGDAYAFAHSLGAHENVEVRRNLSAADMAVLFRSAEFAVLPASTVTVEAIICGCSVMAGYYVDNQVECHDQWAIQGYITPLGDLLADDTNLKILKAEFTPQSFCLNTSVIDNYKELFERLSLRIVDYIDLTIEESRAVWALRNEEQIRRFMASTAPFSLESHLSFVERLRTRRVTDRYLAVYRGARLIGGYSVVNIDTNKHSVDRGLFLDPRMQGSGLAARMETILDDTLRDEFDIKQLNAQVLVSNQRSLNYHLKMGYEIVQQNDAFYYLSRQI